MTDTTQGADAPDDASLFNEATNADTLEKFENPPLPPQDKPADKPTDKSVEKEQPDPAVPAGRFREETEARRRLERERDELRGRLDVYERMQQQQPSQQQPQGPDIFEDPRGFVQQEVHPYIAHMMATQRRNSEILSENWAIRQFGREKVVTARETLGQGLQSRDPEAIVTYQQAMQSPDPYDVIMQWHQRRQTLALVGDDPDAYRKRILEEAENDPEYQKRVIAAAKGGARHVNVPAGQQRPSVSPSLSNIGAGGRDEQQHEPSDMDLFRAVNAAKRR